MISDENKKKIVKIAKRYNVSKIILFGSCAQDKREGNDIDLAVEGVSPSEFYNFYGDLLFGLPKPVDIVNLSHKNKFTQMIFREGIILYGPSS